MRTLRRWFLLLLCVHLAIALLTQDVMHEFLIERSLWCLGMGMSSDACLSLLPDHYPELLNSPLMRYATILLKTTYRGVQLVATPEEIAAAIEAPMFGQ